MTVPFQLAQKLMEWVRWGQYASSFLSLSFSVSKMGVTVKNGETLTCQDSGKTGEVRNTMVKLPAVPARPGDVGQFFQSQSPRWKLEGKKFIRECSQDHPHLRGMKAARMSRGRSCSKGSSQLQRELELR